MIFCIGKKYKEHAKMWFKLLNGGHIVGGTKAPEVCPACSHPKAYFEIKTENY